MENVVFFRDFGVEVRKYEVLRFFVYGWKLLFVCF